MKKWSKRRKIKARSIMEPWSVSMWEPPQPVAEQVFKDRQIDDKGNQTLRFEIEHTLPQSIRSKNHNG